MCWIDVKICLNFSAICIHPCVNGGECTSPNTCTCKPGYEGTRCERGKLI
jgi:hypothetical protein